MTLGHDRRILLLALLAGLPSLAAAAVLLWLVPASALLRGTVLGALLLGWLVAARAAQLRVVRPLQVIANLLAGLREGHFTLRAREEESDDVLGAVRREVNALQETLRDQRLGALEADALLRRGMEGSDGAVFAFAPAGAATGKWEGRRRPFRQGGLPLDMVVLADISRVLRAEERQVWQRLVRVLSHEINNSLAPIKSLAGTMTSLLARAPRPADYEDDLRKGLDVIGARADAPTRLLASHARLATLPPPRKEPLDVGEWV